MKKTLPVIVGLLLLGVLVLFNTTYTVTFHEVAIKKRFGKAEGVEREPGLHLKAPFFIDRVTKIDNRLQLVDSPLETVQTKDGQQILVQSFLLWRVAQDDQGVLRFFDQFGSIDDAGKNLEQSLLTSLRVLGGYEFGELIGPGNKLADAEGQIMAELRRTMLPGIDAVSVGLTQIVLPPKTSQAVMRRMLATQDRLAETERSRGNAEAELIRSEAATKADKIRAFAEQVASEIEAEGNRAAARYFEQMKDNQELAIFLSWLDAFRQSLRGNTTVILDTTREPFHLLDLESPVGAGAIPMPRGGVQAPGASPTVPPAASPSTPPPSAPEKRSAAPGSDQPGANS